MIKWAIDYVDGTTVDTLTQYHRNCEHCSGDDKPPEPPRGSAQKTAKKRRIEKSGNVRPRIGISSPISPEMGGVFPRGPTWHFTGWPPTREHHLFPKSTIDLYSRTHAFQRFAPNTMVGLDYRPLYSRMVIMQSLGGSIPTYRRFQ